MDGTACFSNLRLLVRVPNVPSDGSVTLQEAGVAAREKLIVRSDPDVRAPAPPLPLVCKTRKRELQGS